MQSRLQGLPQQEAELAAQRQALEAEGARLEHQVRELAAAQQELDTARLVEVQGVDL